MSVYTHITCGELSVGISATHNRHEGYYDHEVLDIGILEGKTDPVTKKYVHITHSLMKGVDVRSKDIQQLFANILEHCDLEAWAAEADANASDAYDYEMERRYESGLLAGQAGRGL